MQSVTTEGATTWTRTQKRKKTQTGARPPDIAGKLQVSCRPGGVGQLDDGLAAWSTRWGFQTGGSSRVEGPPPEIGELPGTGGSSPWIRASGRMAVIVHVCVHEERATQNMRVMYVHRSKGFQYRISWRYACRSWCPHMCTGQDRCSALVEQMSFPLGTTASLLVHRP